MSAPKSFGVPVSQTDTPIKPKTERSVVASFLLKKGGAAVQHEKHST